MSSFKTTLDALVTNYSTEGSITCTWNYGFYGDFDDITNTVENNGGVYIIGNVQQNDAEPMVINTCGSRLVGITATYSVIDKQDDSCVDKLRTWLLETYSPDGTQLGPRRSFPLTYGTLTFYKFRLDGDIFPNLATPQYDDLWISSVNVQMILELL